MKVTKTLILCFIFFSFSSTFALAEWSAKMKIVRLETTNTVPIPMQFITNISVASSCGQNYFQLLSTTPNYKEIYAMLLAAFSSGKEVDFWLGACSGTTVSVVHARVYQ